MTIISDSSVLMNLAAIGHLELLPAIFTRIIIPQAVFDETVLKGTGKPGSEEVKTASWIEVKSCADHKLLSHLLTILNEGESEAIVLMKELQGDLLIIDEKKGRQVAKKMNLNVTGLIGVLLIAKSRQLVPLVEPLLDRLQNEAKFWISKATRKNILEIGGE
jgi:uncharacterized protein